MKGTHLIAIVILMVSTSMIGCIDHANPSENRQLSAIVDTLGTVPVIDANEAINITTNNDTIKEFLNQKFKAPNRRNVHVALVQNATYNLTGASAGVNESPFLWKVDLIERSCSCGVRGKSLYVATALINPETGEVVETDTYSIPETEYGRDTCANSCHK